MCDTNRQRKKMSFFLLLCGSSMASQQIKFFNSAAQYERTITVYRNGGNNTHCGSEAGENTRRQHARICFMKKPKYQTCLSRSCNTAVAMSINTVTEDFAFFKARAGCKLNYIPHDCTEWSYSRPRRPAGELCLPVNGARSVVAAQRQCLFLLFMLMPQICACCVRCLNFS